MRVVVCADLEGVGGVDAYEDCFPAWPVGYGRSQDLMEGEVAAVIAGLRDEGVDDIVVTDWHFLGNNLRRDRFDVPVIGEWKNGIPRLDRSVYGSVDLAIFVGMHAAAGDPGAFMSHTFWAGLALEVDGLPVNEAYLWATMVAAGGARVGLVSGDARVGTECEILLPGVPTVAVKSSESRTEASTTRRPEEIREQLREESARAVRERVDRPHVPGPLGSDVHLTFYEQSWADRAAKHGLGEPDGERRIGTVLDRPDGLVPLLAEALLTTLPGREVQLASRLAPPPERTDLAEPVRRLLVSCVHGVTRPLVRRGVREWMSEEVSRYPRLET